MNNMEWSIIFWIFIFIVFLLLKKSMHNSTVNLLKSLLRLFLQPAFQIFLIYQLIVISLLIIASIRMNMTVWLIKDYLLTVFISILPFTSGKDYGFSFKIIGKVLFQSFTISTIISFLTSQYTFSLIAELILVPLVLFITILIAVADTNSNYSKVSKLFNFILLLLAITMLVHSIFELILNLKDLDSLEFWIDFFSDFIFWILNIPILIFWQYINQLDFLLSFLDIKKNVFSFFIYLFKIRLLYIRNRKHLKTVDLSNILKLTRSGIAKKCYFVILKNTTSTEDIKNIILLLRTNHGPVSIYPDGKKIYPLKIVCIDENSNLLFKWQDPLIKDYLI